MTLLVVLWGLDYIIAKNALTLLAPMSLLFCKYTAGFLTVLLIKMKLDPKARPRKKDLPLFICCSIMGEILYFSCEYTAMDYMPVSLITIILAFVPVVSIIIERVLYKRRATKTIVIGILICVFGVVLIIGVDFRILLEGRIIGYLLAFAAVFAWNCFNFITTSLRQRYSSITLTATQLLCTILIIAPYALHQMPPAAAFTPSIIVGVLYLGIVSAGFGFLIQVRSLHILGPTVTSLFSNFLPITATFFGWLILGETITAMQIIGGAIVISAGCVVIKEKGKLEESTDEGI